jgi:hypothetical protein
MSTPHSTQKRAFSGSVLLHDGQRMPVGADAVLVGTALACVAGAVGAARVSAGFAAGFNGPPQNMQNAILPSFSFLHFGHDRIAIGSLY